MRSQYSVRRLFFCRFILYSLLHTRQCLVLECMYPTFLLSLHARFYYCIEQRPNIPPSIRKTTPTSALSSLDDWGPPSANFPSGTHCNITNYFGSQSLVLDITLCGTWWADPHIRSTQRFKYNNCLLGQERLLFIAHNAATKARLANV